VEVKSLKGEDESRENSSLLFLSSSSSDCGVSLFFDKRDSLLFISSIDDMKSSSSSSHYNLTFEGNLFLLCSFSLSLIHSFPSFDSSFPPSDSLKAVTDVEWENETVCNGSVEKSLIDEAEDELSVFGCVFLIIILEIQNNQIENY
jgi:hypothetical protein